MGEVSPTLNPLVTEFKNYFIATKEADGYVYAADQQVVLRYFLFLINRQSQAYSVMFNAREIKGLGNDDLTPEEEFVSQYTFVENEALKELTSFWQTKPGDRPSNYVPLWPPDESCPVKDFAVGQLQCSAGKVMIGVRFKVYSGKIGGIEICEAAVGALGIPKEEGTWLPANQSELAGHTNNLTSGIHVNSYYYDDTVINADLIDVLTGIHLAYDSSISMSKSISQR